jgi:hypothetical protein
MALTPSRWLALAVILCGFAVALVLREPGARRNNTVSDDLRDRESLASEHVSVGVERLRLLQIVDSVHRAIGDTRDSRSRVVVAGNIPSHVRQVIDLMVKRAATSRPTAPLVPVDLVFLIDTTSAVRGVRRLGAFAGAMRADYVLPRPNSADRCLVIARTRAFNPVPGRRSGYASLLGDFANSRLLGPCGFYESFGQPGAGTRAWLTSRGWSIGTVSTWQLGAPRWSSRWTWRYGMESGIPFSDWELRYAMSLRGFACAAGSTAACDSAAIIGPSPSRRVARGATTWGGRIVSPRKSLDAGDRNYYWWWNAAQELGPREETVLAEMARSLGAERFSRVWRSEKPFRESFRAESGKDVGTWTQEWTGRAYESQHSGAGQSLWSALLGIAIAGAALLTALSVASRRQVA